MTTLEKYNQTVQAFRAISDLRFMSTELSGEEWDAIYATHRILENRMARLRNHLLATEVAA